MGTQPSAWLKTVTLLTMKTAGHGPPFPFVKPLFLSPSNRRKYLNAFMAEGVGLFMDEKSCPPGDSMPWLAFSATCSARSVCLLKRRNHRIDQTGSPG